MGNTSSKPRPYPGPQPGFGGEYPPVGYYPPPRNHSRKGKEPENGYYNGLPPLFQPFQQQPQWPASQPFQGIMMQGQPQYVPGQQAYFTQPTGGLGLYGQPQMVAAQTVVQPAQPQPQYPIQPQPQPQPQPQYFQPQPEPEPESRARFGRRAATPFHRGEPMSSESSTDSSIESDPMIPPYNGQQQSQSQYGGQQPSQSQYGGQQQSQPQFATQPAPLSNPLPQPPYIPPPYMNIPGMPSPLPPPNQAVYGPPGPRPRTPLRNPLPPPPRDLYELEPYRALTESLQDIWGHQWQSDRPNEDEPSSSRRVRHQRSKSEGGGLFGSWGRSRREKKPKKEKKSGGLFRSFSLTSNSRRPVPTAVPARGRQRRPEIPHSLMQMLGSPNPDAVQRVEGTDQEIYVDTSRSPEQAHAQAQRMAPQPTPVIPMRAASSAPNPNSLSPMTLFNLRSPGLARTPALGPSTHMTPGPIHPFTPYMPQQQPVLFSTQDSREYAGFLLSSPDKILFRDTLWPTAYHLLEAMRFMRDNEEPADLRDLQERVRLCKTIPEVQAFVTGAAQWKRPDWDQVVLSKVDEVLYMKFSQHEDLRELLLETGDRELVYTEFNDGFWSAWPQAPNQLGLALMRVRSRMQNEMRDG